MRHQRFATSGNIFSNVARGLGSVLSSEVVQTVAGAGLAMFGVPPGVTKAGVGLAGNLVQKAAGGDPRAIQRKAAIAQGAARGEPAAQRAQAAVTHVVRSQNLARLAANLLRQVEAGLPQATAALQQIAQNARRGDPEGAMAAKAVREVLAAAYRVLSQIGQPPPPARAAIRRPPPPARGAPRPPVQRTALDVFRQNANQ